MGFEALGKKLVRLGQDTKSGVQKMGETYQINSKIADEKKNLEKLYQIIGKAVYEANPDAPVEGLEDEYASIKEALDVINEFSEKLNKVKGVLYCEECGKEAVKGEKFCSQCGAKLPENPEDDITEKMKQDAKEAVSEAGDIVGDVADKAKSFMGDVADKANAFVKGVSSKVNSQEKDAEDVIDEAKEQAEEAAEAVCEKAEAAAEVPVEDAEDFTDAVTEKVEDETNRF